MSEVTELREYAVSVLLTGQDGGRITSSHTLSVRRARTADEARGQAVAFALQAKPHLSVTDVLVADIRISLDAEP